MQHPVVGDNKRKKLCRLTVKFCELWSVTYFLRPLLFVLPPMIITLAVTKKSINTDIIELFGRYIGNLINNSGLIIIIGLFLYITIMKALYAAIYSYSKPAKDVDIDDLLAILKALNLVVGDKCKRMSNEVKKVLAQTTICPATTFNNITHPEQQIPLLIAGIRSVFEYMDKTNAMFRTGLLRIASGKPIEWVAFEPASNPPRTAAKNLSVPTSTVMHAIKNKSIIVVADIQAELNKKSKAIRRFVKSNTQESDQGSQLCYPVVHPATGDVEYVITIAGNKKDSLVENYAELYTWIIEHFSLRLSLEHSLLILKEKSNE